MTQTNETRWRKFSIMNLPGPEFVLIYVHFETETNPKASPRVLIAYYSHQDGEWRTHYGRLQGRVSHWMPLPQLPVVEMEDNDE